MIVGTPSGVTLAPEGGAHQSIGSPLIGMSQDGLAAFEPAFADELAVIMKWAFDYMQKDGEGDPDERTWLRDETGGSVYLRLTTNPIEQPGTRADEDFRQGAIDGAYWLRKPGPNCEVVIAYQGVVAPEAIRAAGRIAEIRRDVGVLAVTSADRLNAGWTAAQRARARGNPSAKSHIETLTAALPRHCKIVTVIDGHPATLGLDRLGARPPDDSARRGAFRPDRNDRRSLRAFRHQCRGHRAGSHRSVRRTPGHAAVDAPRRLRQPGESRKLSLQAAPGRNRTGRDGGRGAGARPGRWRARLNRRGRDRH
jgi:pyruvate dehydrogenase complex dehydrogenase (E1) component